MTERTGVITFQGNGLTLLGNPVEAGARAPEFTALANDLSPRHLADYAGKVVILSAVPSLDTPVCDAQTRRFNQEAAALGDDVRILTLSADLPFAQARWCGAAGVSAVETLSDHAQMSFADAYGVHIKELRLLARAVFVVDRGGALTHAQIVPEVTHEPDYAAVVAAAKAAL